MLYSINRFGGKMQVVKFLAFFGDNLGKDLREDL